MSDLLNQASLVMIPSGYKEDVVYSQIPTDGSGDLSFTRASNGTRVNSAGLVEVTPWNLFEYSEDFSNAFWTKVRSTITTNTTAAPNGTTTADTFTCTETGINGCFLYNSPSLSIERTTSVYVKANTCFYFQIHRDYGSGVVFDLTNGTIKQSSGATGTITSVGNGWYRCTATFSATGASLFLLGNENMTVSSWYTTINQNLYIWGAQLNIGSTAKPYFPTTDRLNVPRLTYQNGGGGCPSLLLEKQSTNIATQSTITSFGTGQNDWLNGANSPASINQTTGIDGTQNGTKYTKTAGQTTNDDFYKNQVPVTSGTIYTVSGYIKLGTASNAVVVINNTLAWNSVPNGSIVCSTANGFSTTEWKRFELTITGPSTNRINIHFGHHNETGVAAQATGTFFLDGFQIEASSYATSLIPTTSSSATRVADACSKTGISSLIGQTEGTVFLDFVFNGYMDSIEELSLTADSNNRIGLYTYDGTATLRAYIVASNYVPFEANVISLTIGQRYKVAFAYKSGDCNIYVNGVTQLQNSNSFTIGSTLNAFRFNNLGGTSPFYKPVNQTILFPTRLTNAELASLTTI